MLVAAIWNLVFLLDAPAIRNRYLLTGTRVAPINALAELSDVFCRSDSTLTRQAFAKLLSIPSMVVRILHHLHPLIRLDRQGSDEERAVKHTLTTMMESILQTRAGEGSDASATTTRIKFFNVYLVFQPLLTSHREEQYDLLQWAVRTYTDKLMMSSKG